MYRLVVFGCSQQLCFEAVVFGCCFIVQGNTKCRLSGGNGLVMIGSS